MVTNIVSVGSERTTGKHISILESELKVVRKRTICVKGNHLCCGLFLYTVLFYM